VSRALLGTLLLVLLIGGGLALVLRGERPIGGDAPAATMPASAAAMTTAESCRECHPEVFEEWRASQHAIAFTNPLVRREDMADGFRKKDCIPCHAPRPVFEHGLGKAARVLARDVNRVDGVDCLSCHRVADGVAAARHGLSAPCAPVHRAELVSTDLCAPCHNQHMTVDEWERSPAAVRGDNCNHCHMPPVERPARDGLPARIGRSHRTLGGNDPALLKAAATLGWRIDDGDGGRRLVVTITNTGCAHNLPTDARHRAVDLVVTLQDAAGAPRGAAVDLGPGERGGTARLRFRNPYRDESGKSDTQIPAGEAREIALLLEGDLRDAAGAEILLLYKRTPFLTDPEAVVVQREAIRW
jgi:hypothetical protein